ncbi:MAG: hypothetical protein WA755_09165 [Candidatus Acidiferrales bacterium]
MSALLDAIINTATDGDQHLSVLLRKCLVLAHELKNERLKAWANQELNGYRAVDSVPEYRIVHADAKGTFMGPFGSEARNWPIPPVGLENEDKPFADRVCLRQAVSAYENATAHPEGSISFPWPANMVVYYQRRFFKGHFALISA